MDLFDSSIEKIILIIIIGIVIFSSALMLVLYLNDYHDSYNVFNNTRDVKECTDKCISLSNELKCDSMTSNYNSICQCSSYHCKKEFRYTTETIISKS